MRSPTPSANGRALEGGQMLRSALASRGRVRRRGRGPEEREDLADESSEVLREFILKESALPNDVAVVTVLVVLGISPVVVEVRIAGVAVGNIIATLGADGDVVARKRQDQLGVPTSAEKYGHVSLRRSRP
jgi:hypothetical protein